MPGCPGPSSLSILSGLSLPPAPPPRQSLMPSSLFSPESRGLSQSRGVHFQFCTCTELWWSISWPESPHRMFLYFIFFFIKNKLVQRPEIAWKLLACDLPYNIEGHLLPPASPEQSTLSTLSISTYCVNFLPSTKLQTPWGEGCCLTRLSQSTGCFAGNWAMDIFSHVMINWLHSLHMEYQNREKP